MNAQDKEYTYTDPEGFKHYRDFDRKSLMSKEERVLDSLNIPAETKKRILRVCKVFKGKIVLIKDRKGNIEFQNGII